MKRFLSILLSILILTSLLVGCENGLPVENITESPHVSTSTEAVSEAPTDAPTEAPTETPTEAPTEAPTETPTEAPTEATTETPTEAPTEATTIHKHDYTDATCTTPKTCTICGETSGEALGHDWVNATCTQPKTCSSCGKTSGEENGHNWKDATCTSPKTCESCGQTKGNVADHHYSEGICRHCGAEDPFYSDSTMVWIPTKGGKKYHTHAGCSNMIDPEYVTLEEAEDRGFTPCKRCH